MGERGGTPREAAAPPRGGGRWAAVITLVLGVWSVLLLALGPPLGFGLPVPTSVEVISHVIPGIVVIGSASACLLVLRRGAVRESLLYLLATGFSFLSGLWMTVTHLPLVAQAADRFVAWGPALWHSWPGPVVLSLSVVQFLRQGRIRSV